MGAVPRARAKIDRRRVADELDATLPGVPAELLADLHLLTRGGDLNADARRKLKQIAHLIGLLRPALDDVLARHADPVVVDCGAGKSYLGFLLYATVLGPAGRGTLVGIESRPALVAAGEDRARRWGMDRMRLVAGAIAEAPVPDRVHLVTALHACDTATDDALALAIGRGADHVAVVPCCQAEVARQLAGARVDDPAVACLFAHPWHRRELGSHLTNVVRALALEARGYQVTVTELAGWEHSLKNELIRGKRVARYDQGAQARLDALCARFGIQPALVRALAARDR
jgi:Methyltransferase domain